MNPINKVEAARYKAQILESIEKLEKSMGIVMHHDAITGTCTTVVQDDYLREMKNSKGLMFDNV